MESTCITFIIPNYMYIQYMNRIREHVDFENSKKKELLPFITETEIEIPMRSIDHHQHQ